MAKVILNPNEERTLYNINDDIFGALGQEVVTVAPATTGVKMDQNVERVELNGDLSDFLFLQAGNNLKVYSGPNTLVATILVQDDSNGTQITFADGTVNAKFDKAGTLPVIKMGDATVSGSTPAHVSVGSAYIDHDLVTPPAPEGHVFTLIEAKEQVTTPGHEVLLWEGLPVEAHSIEEFLKSVAEVDFAELGKNMNDIISIKDIHFDNKDGEASGTIVFNLADGTTIDINTQVSLQYLAFIKNLIFDEQGNPRLTIGHTPDHVYEKDAAIVLTPTANNGGTFESGYTTDGDDLIVAGRTELLHGAYINGGGGWNTLEADMKGVFAQPLELLNIQEIHVQNLPNVYTLPEHDYQGGGPAVAGYGGHRDNGGSSYPDLSPGGPDVVTSSTLDLTRAIDLQKLVITEGDIEYDTEFGNVPLGDLNIVGIRNGATVRLEGGFSQDVNLHFGEGIRPEGVNLELLLGDTEDFHLKIAQNSSTLNIKSLGTENMLDEAFCGGNLRYLNISGNAAFYVEDDLNSSFREGRPATINASSNTGGVDLNISGHEVIEFKGSSGNDHFKANGTLDLLTGVETAGLDLSDLNPLHAVKLLTITGGSGNNVYETALFETANITSGGGNDTICAVLGINVNIDAGAGNNTITASAQNINITTGAGNDTITVAGLDLDHLKANYYDPDHVIDGFAAGAVLHINAGGGTNTVILSNAISELLPSYISDILPDLPIGLVALEGSSITGSNITLKVDTDSNLSAASLTGITSVVLDADLTLTADQAADLGADAFTTVHPQTTDHVEELHIIVDHDVTLGELLDLTALDSSVKLAFEIRDGATLTLSAEELHFYVAEDGISVTPGLNGKVVLTDAGLHFDPFHDNGADDIDNGTLFYSFHNSDDLTIIRTVDGFERPEPGESTDTLIIDSDVTPIVPPPPDTDTIRSDLRTLKIIGSSDLEFRAPINIGEKFTIDFSQLDGDLTGLTVKQFEDAKQIIGHDTPDGFHTRINVEMTGDVGKPGLEFGLKTSGVSEYVVTDLHDADRIFYTCDNTHDIEVLGLQGNQGHSITFEGVPWGQVHPSFLLEGDGYANFDGGSKADADPNESNIGTLNVDFFYPGAPAVINITNQGVALGVTSDGEPRPLVVDGINLLNAESVTINVADGNAEIREIDGNQQLEDVTLNSDFGVTLHVDGNESSLELIDASHVAGIATLVIESDAGVVDFSETILKGIEQVVLTQDAELTLDASEIARVGYSHIVLQDEADYAVLNVTDLGTAPFDATKLAEGIDLGFVSIVDLKGCDDNVVTLDAHTDLTGADYIYVPEGTVLNLSAAQFAELEGAGTISGPGLVNITGITQEIVDAGLDLSHVENAGHVTFAGDVVLAADTNLGDFGIDLADGQKLTMTDFFQADGRDIDGGANTTVVLDFTWIPAEPFNHIDVSHYENLTDLQVLNRLIETSDDGIGNNNVEDLLQQLAESTHVVVIDEHGSVVDVTPINRTVFIEPGVTVADTVIFNDLDPAREIANLNLTLMGDAHITGDLNLSTQSPAGFNADYFHTLAITSQGDATTTAANSIDGYIHGGTDGEESENNILDVQINASRELNVGGVVFTSLMDNAAATLTVNGTADVTIGTLSVLDEDVDTLNIVNNGAGTLHVTGVLNDPALIVGGDEKINLSGSGDMVFGSATTSTVDNEFLTNINAANLTGDLDLGVLADVSSSNFVFTSGTGETDLVVADTIDAGGTWIFNMTNAGAGSSLTFTDVTAFTNNGTVNVLHDADTTVTVSDAAIDTQWEVNLLQNSTCIDVIDLTVNGAVTLDQASALADNKLSTNGIVTASDVAIDTQAEVNALQALAYVDVIDITPAGAVTLDQASALADNKLSDNGTVTVHDAAVDTQAEVDALAALSYVDLIDVVATQAEALAGQLDAGAKAGTYTVSDVTIDTAAEVAALQALPYVDVIDLTAAGAVTLDYAEALAFDKLGTNGNVTVADVNITTQAQVQALQALAYVDHIDLTAAGAVTVDVATFQADKLGYNGVITVADTGDNIASMTQGQLHSVYLDLINATDDYITLTADQYTAIDQGTALIDASDNLTIKSDTGIDFFNFNTVGGGAITLEFAPGSLGDVVVNFDPATDVIAYTALNAAPQAFESVAAGLGGDITTNANIIVLGGVANIDLAAQKIAGDADVTQAAGLIVFSDGNNTYVYASDNLADNGTETLVVQLTGISDPTVLTNANFVI